jgi:hypothetical protein
LGDLVLEKLRLFVRLFFYILIGSFFRFLDLRILLYYWSWVYSVLGILKLNSAILDEKSDLFKIERTWLSIKKIR